jgi:hypothetical protein
VSGLTVVPLVVDDVFDEAAWLVDADWLVDALAFALADDEALFLGEGEVLLDGEDTAAAWVGAVLVQVGSAAVGWIVFLAVPPEAGLVLGLTVLDAVAVVVGVLPGLSLGLTLALALAEALALALAEALALALALELAVLPLLWPPLDDVAGAVTFPVVLLAGAVLVTVTD